MNRDKAEAVIRRVRSRLRYQLRTTKAEYFRLTRAEAEALVWSPPRGPEGEGAHD